MKIYEVYIGDEYEKAYRSRFYTTRKMAKKDQQKLIKQGYDKTVVNEVEVFEENDFGYEDQTDEEYEHDIVRDMFV